jgi:hypothetical protein
MKHLQDVVLIFHEPFEEATEGILARHRRLTLQRVETAELPELSVSSKLPPDGFDVGVLIDDAGDNGIPGRPDRVVVTAFTAAFLEDDHQILVDQGQSGKDAFESVEVARGINFFPAK